MIAVSCRRMAVFSAVVCLAGLGSSAHADWTACQSKPSRACLLQEALGGGGAPLAGKDRLDVLIQGNATSQPGFVTAADIDEALRQAKSNNIGQAFPYAVFAIRGLVAANQKQQAMDLVAGFHGAILNLAFAELTRTLAKAGDVDTSAALLDRIAPTLDQSARGYLGHIRISESVKTLASAGKIDDALPLMMSVQTEYPESDVAEMQMAIAQAYVTRGDAKTARRYFDLAGQALEKGQQYTLGAGAEQQRFTAVALSALRGDTDAVKAGLQKLQVPATNGLSAYMRGQAYQRIVTSLLQAKQYPLALEIAKSLSGYDRDAALLQVITQNASDGRIDDAQAVLSLFGEKTDPKTRAAAIRPIAVAMAKAGKPAPAVGLAAQASDPAIRQGTLLAIALAMPQ